MITVTNEFGGAFLTSATMSAASIFSAAASVVASPGRSVTWLGCTPTVTTSVFANSGAPAASANAARSGSACATFSEASPAAVSFGCRSCGFHPTVHASPVRATGSVPSYVQGVPIPGSSQRAVYAAVAWSSSCVVTVPSVAVSFAPSPSALRSCLSAPVAEVGSSVWPAAPAVSLPDQAVRNAVAASSGPGLSLPRKQPEASRATAASSATSGRRRTRSPWVRTVGTQNRTLANVPTLRSPTRSYARRAGRLKSLT